MIRQWASTGYHYKNFILFQTFHHLTVSMIISKWENVPTDNVRMEKTVTEMVTGYLRIIKK